MKRHHIILGASALAAAFASSTRAVVMTPEEHVATVAKLDAERKERGERIRARDEEYRREQASKKDSALNRHTGEPHAHARAKARRLRQIGAA